MNSILNRLIKITAPSIQSGLFIGLGGALFLTVGGVIGAIGFSFGLLAVVHNKKPLFTGKTGFCESSKDLKNLPLILLLNIIGTVIIGVIIKQANPKLITIANELALSRLSLTPVQVILKAFCCGFIMTTVVKSAREDKYLPLLFGVPLFILCGFIHCIADAFYYSVCDLTILTNNVLKFTFVYILSVLGNFIGCVTPNIINGSIYLNSSSNNVQNNQG